MKRAGVAALAAMVVIIGMGSFVITHRSAAADTIGGSGPVQVPPNQCSVTYDVPCYSPQDMYSQYNLNPLYQQGLSGKGQTIALFVTLGSPTIENDLAVFDAAYHLPAPPSFQIITPVGRHHLDYSHLHDADFNKSEVQTELAWSYETTLDVEWAHAIAPGANILLVVAPQPETSGMHGLPPIIKAEQYVLDNHLARIFSQSFDTSEATFHGGDFDHLRQFDDLFAAAAAQGVTVLASSGDYGTGNLDEHNKVIPYPTVSVPATAACLTSVGGTAVPAAPASIAGYSPEIVWQDTSAASVAGGASGASGGGFSPRVPKPYYQSGVVPGPYRGIPDVAYNASVQSAITIFESFDPQVGSAFVPGYGTSEGAPQWAGIAALADEYAAIHSLQPVGFLNPALYQIGRDTSRYSRDFHDITSGNNGFNGVFGFNAGAGWDAATGWGTPDAANLVPDLARLAQASQPACDSQ